MLFSDRSTWTMIHGVVFGGAALLALAAALFSLWMAGRGSAVATEGQSRSFALLTTFIAAALWLAVLGGTFVVFPLYRATPPAGATDLGLFPRALLMAHADTVWLHAFAMEIKEHVPWIASMLATAVAFASMRYQARLLNDRPLRSMAMALLAISFALTSFAGLLGTFINKVAPVQ